MRAKLIFHIALYEDFRYEKKGKLLRISSIGIVKGNSIHKNEVDMSYELNSQAAAKGM